MKFELLFLAVMIVIGTASCEDSPPPFIERPSNYLGGIEDVIPSDDDLVGQPTLASAEWVFEASTIDEVNAQFDPTTDKVRQFGSMIEETVKAQIQHKQLVRAQKVEVFQQGSDQQSISEFFKQNENDDAQGLLDVLVVIDNSSSMLEEQLNLSSKMLPLLSFVEESDWRIGVVTTDQADGCLRDVIYKNQANPGAAFSSAIRAGVTGSGIEAGVPQAVRALSPGCLGGQSWLRPNSTIAILIVSDEDNCSEGTRCPVSEHNSADYLIDYLSEIRVVGVNAKVFGLIWHSSQPQSQCQSAFRQGHIYSDLIARTGGSWGSICDSDYSETLEAMSLDLSIILKKQFALQYNPFIESLEVIVNNVKMNSGYIIRENVIEFDEAPPPGAKISINYKFTTSEPQDTFTLAENADQGSMMVYLDGQPTNDFTYNSNAKTLNFSSPPQAREIKVLYRISNQLEKRFAIEPSLDPAGITVAVEGNQVDPGEYVYDSMSGHIVFAEAPEDGSSIAIEFLRSIGPQLAYPVFAPEGSLGSVAVLDEFGTPMGVSVEGKTIIFDPDEFILGKSFIIEYANVLTNEQIIQLGYEVYEDNLSVEGMTSGTCTNFILDDSMVDFSPCLFGLDEVVVLNFKYVKSHVQEFSLVSEDYDLDSLMTGNYQFVVTVNGEGTDGFEVMDRTLRLNDELPIGAVVTIKLFRGNDS